MFEYPILIYGLIIVMGDMYKKSFPESMEGSKLRCCNLYISIFRFHWFASVQWDI